MRSTARACSPRGRSATCVRRARRAIGLRRTRPRSAAARPTMVLRARQLARRQAVARGALDRARQARAAAKAGASRCRKAARSEQTRAELIAAALQFERDPRVEVWPSLDLDAVVDRMARRAGRDRRRQRPQPHRGRARICRMCRSTTSRPRGAPARSRRTATRIRCRCEARPHPTLDAVWPRGSRCWSPPRDGCGADDAGGSALARACVFGAAARCCTPRRTCCACGGAAAPSRCTATRSASGSAATTAPAARGWVWVHAVSLGETRAAAALIDALRARATRHATAADARHRDRPRGRRGAAARRRPPGLAAVRHAGVRASILRASSARRSAC